MKSIPPLVLILSITLAPIHAISIERNSSSETLCQPTLEITVASCEVNTPKKTLMSICASSDNYGKDFGTIAYLYGSKSKLQLKKQFKQVGTVFRGVDDGTYTTFLGVKNGTYLYVVGIPEEKINAKAFLQIYNNGKEIQTLECKTNSFGLKFLPSSIFKEIDGRALSLGSTE